MEGISRILVGVDFSDYTLSTVRAGLGFAQDAKAEVILLNVINSRDLVGLHAAHALSEKISEKKYIEDQAAYRRERLAAVIDEASCKGIEPEIEIRVGDPADTIIQTVEDRKADMVVIGTKGRSNLSYLLFGSVAEKVHRHCPVSVLSVRGQAHAQLLCRLKE